MAGDITVDGHELGPFIGAESLGYHSICDCGNRFDAPSMNEVVDLYERHYARIALDAPADRPGPAKCKAALAEAIARKGAS